MVDFIIIAILLGIAAAIIFYLVRQKKQGVHCIGCPHGKQCSSHKKEKSQDSCGSCNGCQSCSGSCSGCGNNCCCGTNESDNSK